MKVATQEIERSQVVLDIEVEAERLNKALDLAYSHMVHRVKVPGFRPGKAPRALVERTLGRPALLEHALEHLVPDVIDEAVRDNRLDLVARPSVEIVSAEPLQLKATVPVRPAVELGDYKSLKIEKAEPAADDEEVDRVITRLREDHATWEPVERAVEAGDRIALDLKAVCEGESFIDTQNAEFIVDLEREIPAPGFAAEVIGMAAGEEKTFDLTMPEDYRVAGRAGKVATFTVTLHGVKARNIPELDDELAATVSADYETADQLRDDVRKQLLERSTQRTAAQHQDDVINAVVDQATLEIPPQLVEEEAQRLLNRFVSGLQRSGLAFEQYMRFSGQTEDSLRDEYTRQGERTARRDLVLQAIAAAEGIAVSNDEVRDDLLRSGATERDVKRFFKNAERQADTLDRIRSSIAQTRAAIMLLQTVGGLSEAAAKAAVGAAVDSGDSDDEDPEAEVASS